MIGHSVLGRRVGLGLDVRLELLEQIDERRALVVSRRGGAFGASERGRLGDLEGTDCRRYQGQSRDGRGERRVAGHGRHDAGGIRDEGADRLRQLEGRERTMRGFGRVQEIPPSVREFTAFGSMHVCVFQGECLHCSSETTSCFEHSSCCFEKTTSCSSSTSSWFEKTSFSSCLHDVLLREDVVFFVLHDVLLREDVVFFIPHDVLLREDVVFFVLHDVLLREDVVFFVLHVVLLREDVVFFILHVVLLREDVVFFVLHVVLFREDAVFFVLHVVVPRLHVVFFEETSDARSSTTSCFDETSVRSRPGSAGGPRPQDVSTPPSAFRPFLPIKTK